MPLENVTRLRLDRDYTLLSAVGLYCDRLSQYVGRNIWKAFPDAEHLFRPIYDRAWKDESYAMVVAYRQQLLEMHAAVDGDHLIVTCRTLTLEGLEEALRLIVCARCPREDQALRGASARSGRAVPHLRAL